MREGLYYRLTSPLEDAIAAWGYVAEDGSEALVSAVVLNVEGYGVANYVVPRGLTRGALYREEYSDTVYAADAIMDMGIPLPVGSAPYMSRMYHFVRIDA